MAEAANLKLGKKVGFGIIGGVSANLVDVVLILLRSWLNVSIYDEIEYSSQQFFGTIPGDPNVALVIVMRIVTGAVAGVLFGVLIHLLQTRAGLGQNRSRYMIVSVLLYLAIGVSIWVGVVQSGTEMDVVLDSLIFTITTVIDGLVLGLIYFYLEARSKS